MRYATKQALLDDIEAAHTALIALVDKIPADRYDEAGVWGDDWTATDLMAHLAAWHRMFLRWQADGVAGQTPAMPAPGYTWRETPRLNRDIQARHQGRPWNEVRAEFEGTHRQVVALVRSLGEPELLEPGHFDWTGSNPLATYIGPNTASHYRFAARVLKRWTRGGKQ